MLKMGDRGPKVRLLQEKLVQLGYEPVKVDGVFGPITKWAVLNLQAMFGYTVDGIVGRGTSRLVDTQVSYGWCVKNDNAQRWALKAQGLLSATETREHWS